MATRSVLVLGANGLREEIRATDVAYAPALTLGGQLSLKSGTTTVDETGQLILATGSSKLFIYSGTGGLQFTNQANSASIGTLSNTGDFAVNGQVSAGSDIYANAATAPSLFFGSSLNLSRRGTGILSLGTGARDNAAGTLVLSTVSGTGSGGALTLTSTDNATKGKIYFGTAQTSAFDEVNTRLGIGTNAPSTKLHIYNTTTADDCTIQNTSAGGQASFAISPNGTGWTFGATGSANGTAANSFFVYCSAGGIYFCIRNTGNIGIGITAPTAKIHIKAGTATANTAPLKLTAGTNLTTPEDGAIEYNGTHFYGTIGSARYQLDQQSGQSSGQSTQNGNGTTTAFTITHGLTGITSASKVFITARSSAAVGYGLISLSSTQITINYAVAPASGTGNLVWDWYIIP